MKDKVIQCIQCDSQFVFSIEEQKFFAEKGFDEPTRCHICRKKKSKGINEVQSQGRRKRNGKKKSFRHQYDEDEWD